MAIKRTRKEKESAHYNFLYSWTPNEARVKGESNFNQKYNPPKLSASKKADILAKDASVIRIKKDIIHSLVLVALVLAAEVVVYLGRNRLGIL